MNFSEEGGALLTGKIWKPTFLLELESEPVKNGPAPQHCTVCDRQFIAINFCTSTGSPVPLVLSNQSLCATKKSI